MSDPTTAHHEALLRIAIRAAGRARATGNHPFGAVLVGPAGEVLLEAENTVITTRDVTGHAELNLVRMASQRFDKAKLASFTLYTSTEPCAMCSGAIYWSGIGRVVYALEEESLYQRAGVLEGNFALRLPCREVFSRGVPPVAVIGPLIEDEGWAVHEGFWGRE